MSENLEGTTEGTSGSATEARRRPSVKKLRSPLDVTQRRIEGTFYVLLLPLAVLVGRLVQLQALPAPPASPVALKPETFLRHETIPAHRGQLLAYDGTALAVTTDEYAVFANPCGLAPKSAQDRARVAHLIAQAVGGDESQYLAKLQKPRWADGR